MNTKAEQNDAPLYFEVALWDEATFMSSEQRWQDLLSRSECDPLFLSWQWISAWWNHFGKREGDQLTIIAVTHASKLVGLAPLYRYRSRVLKVFSVERLSYLGTRYQQDSGILSEHLEFITDRHFQTPVIEQILSYIQDNIDWDELVVESAVKTSGTATGMATALNSHLSRELEQSPSYQIHCQQNFEDYVSALGKNTRLKLFNRRKKFETTNSRRETAGQSGIKTVFETINQFQRLRFGKSVFTDKNIAFMKELYEKLPNKDLNLSFSSCLIVDDAYQSAIFNILADDRLYNIQLGYNEKYDKKISLGLLHLGYTIEEAMQAEHVRYIDLLKGGGKTTNYKSRIAEANAVEISVQYIRDPWLKFLYCIHDCFVSPVKQKISDMRGNHS